MGSSRRVGFAVSSAIAIAGVAALWAASGCGSGGGPAGNAGNSGNAAAPVLIDAKNDASAPMGFSFDSPVTVTRGAAVQWSNISSAPHGIVWDAQVPSTSPAPGANIPNFAAGTTSATWTAPNVTVATAYNYHCSVHGPTMAGVINVTP